MPNNEDFPIYIKDAAGIHKLHDCFDVTSVKKLEISHNEYKPILSPEYDALKFGKAEVVPEAVYTRAFLCAMTNLMSKGLKSNSRQELGLDGSVNVA